MKVNLSPKRGRMTVEQADQVTEKLQKCADAETILLAFRLRAWDVKGYARWIDYWDGIKGTIGKVDNETRQRITIALREGGMSYRNIAPVVELHHNTVRSQVTEAHRDEEKTIETGDNRYRQRDKPYDRRNYAQIVVEYGWDVRLTAERLARVLQDDRLEKENSMTIDMLRGQVKEAISLLTDLHDNTL